jgi:hypothetical protein
MESDIMSWKHALILIILLAAASLAHANTQAELNELVKRQHQASGAQEGKSDSVYYAIHRIQRRRNGIRTT